MRVGLRPPVEMMFSTTTCPICRRQMPKQEFDIHYPQCIAAHRQSGRIQVQQTPAQVQQASSSPQQPPYVQQAPQPPQVQPHVQPLQPQVQQVQPPQVQPLQPQVQPQSQPLPPQSQSSPMYYCKQCEEYHEEKHPKFTEHMEFKQV